MVEQHSQLELGAWFFRPAEQILVDPSERQIPLESKTTEVLLCLARANGNLVRRDELILWAWRDVMVSDNSLYRCIYQLRKIFADGQGHTPRIVTVRGRGYRLVIKESESDAIHRAPASADQRASRNASKPKRTARFAPIAFILAVMILGMIGILGSIEPLESGQESGVRGFAVPSNEHQRLLSVSFLDSLDAKEFEEAAFSVEANPARVDSILSSLTTLRPDLSWTVKEPATD